ncbi:elongator complex protein 3 [Acetivibrio clariflavus]|uniref:Histone acetyltransferase n=1 Tax=Acetivibrio clariflavus (strain DSM 19732 / NBRC 101661 / EBR45) TaxID=720554 RepID=G8LZ07_ACECE|nr:radical SAM protein [Acetivibrio clariflavus]AEV68951.1 histone acetyltransferase [Acetivibrio clariflavus DSM 19732]HOQ00725.1 radical SAM protein [Acetivibrio clariflavus]
MKHVIIPIFIPHKGCPFDCIFCNQKKISGQMDEVSESSVRAVIESHLNTISRGSLIEIAFFGGSFTGIDREEQIRYLEIANEYIQNGPVGSIRLSTRPDYIDDDILTYLKKYNVSVIELGVQSLDREVLEKSNRGHSIEDVLTSSKKIKDKGFSLGIQTMIGLPGDSFEKAVDTAKKVVELAPDIVRIYPTLVVKGTYLERLYNTGQYKPLSLEEAVDLCAVLMEIYESNHINVIRVGLQPTDNICDGGDVVAGPFHPAIRQLVESRRALKDIEEIIVKNKLTGKKTLAILADKKDVSVIIGQKKSNIKYLKERYNYEEIKVYTDSNKCECYDVKY